MVSSYGLNNMSQETGSPKMREKFIQRGFNESNFLQRDASPHMARLHVARPHKE